MKGILFKPDMIKAIVEGRKTQTRRVIKPQPYENTIIVRPPDEWRDYWAFQRCEDDQSTCCIKPRYQVGEVVYIKKAYSTYGYPEVPFYKDEPNLDVKAIAWHSPMMMPEKYARYFIQITDVKLQKLQEITGNDALAEGCGDIGIVPINTAMLITNTNTIEDCHKALAVAQYQNLWDSINPKYPWSTNPWVWVYTFKKV